MPPQEARVGAAVGGAVGVGGAVAVAVGVGVGIVEFDIAADGSVWALGSDHTDGRYRPIQVYVIRHDASTDEDESLVAPFATTLSEVLPPPMTGVTY